VKKSRFTEEQVTQAVRQAAAGTAVDDICRSLGISRPTFYNWKKKYGESGASEISITMARLIPIVDTAKLRQSLAMMSFFLHTSLQGNLSSQD
jgi:transposase-like protein